MQVYLTQDVKDLMEEWPSFAQFVFHSLERFKNQDFGELSMKEKANLFDLAFQGKKVFGRYEYEDGSLYIMGDKGRVTILFPKDAFLCTFFSN